MSDRGETPSLERDFAHDLGLDLRPSARRQPSVDKAATRPLELVKPPTTTTPEGPQVSPEIARQMAFYQIAKSRFRDSGLGGLTLLTDQPEEIPATLMQGVNAAPLLRDKAKLAVPAKYHLRTKDIHEACVIAAELGMQVVIIGSLTSATENFGPKGVSYDSDKIIAIDPIGVPDTDQIKKSIDGPYAKSDEVEIDLEAGTLRSGAGLTPDNRNALLPPGKWIPEDLTTRNSAKAILPTGSMGPIRIAPSELMEEVVISDGQTTRVLKGAEIEQHEGLMGLTGAIVETKYKILDVPKNKFGLFVGLKVDTLDPDLTNWDEELANVLAHLYPALNVQIEDKRLVSDWEKGLIDGVEIITVNELTFLLGCNVSEEIKSQARRLIKALEANGSKFAVYLTGRATQPMDTLLEDKDPKNPLSTLIKLQEKSQLATLDDVSGDMELMHSLREAIPLNAKDEAAPENPNPEILRQSFTTDYVTTLSAQSRAKIDQLYGAAKISYIRRRTRKQLAPYLEKQRGVKRVSEMTTNPRIQVKGYSYGHGHLRGVDLHERHTILADLQGATTEEARATTAQFTSMVDASKTGPNKALRDGIEKLKSDPDVDVQRAEKGKLPDFDFLAPEKQAEVANLVENAPAIFAWRKKGTKVARYIEARKMAA